VPSSQRHRPSGLADAGLRTRRADVRARRLVFRIRWFPGPRPGDLWPRALPRGGPRLGLSPGFAALARTHCWVLVVTLAVEPFLRLHDHPHARRAKAVRLLQSYVRIAAAAILTFSPQIASNLVIFGRAVIDPREREGCTG